VNILLVYTLSEARSGRHPLGSMQDIHLGLSQVGGMLTARGHEVRLAVLCSESRRRSRATLDRIVADFNPALIGFTAVATQYPFVNELAGHLKPRQPGTFLLIGGTHATLRPEEALGGAFNAVCLGEGEMAAVELAGQLAAGCTPSGISNLWIRRPDGSVEKNAVRDFHEPLDDLPPPNRAMWETWIPPRGTRLQVVLPSRGCPYQCAYCSNHALHRVAKGRYVRFRAPAEVVREIRRLKAVYPDTAEVYLQSETIAVNLSWLEALSDQIKSFNDGLERPVSFTCNFRVARPFLEPAVFQALARANVRTLEIGLESGSERLRQEVLRRHYSNAEFLQAVALARQHNMKIHLYNMIGMPGETLADHRQTIELNRQVCPDRTFTCIFYPYPGTDLHETCRIQGLLGDERLLSSERVRATLDLPGFSRRQIQSAFERFEYRIYRGHRPLHQRLRKLARQKIYSRPRLNRMLLRLLPVSRALHGGEGGG